jgi:hypothetical protein
VEGEQSRLGGKKRNATSKDISVLAKLGRGLSLIGGNKGVDMSVP